MSLIFLTSMPRAGSTWVANIIGKSTSVNYISGEPFNPPLSRAGFGFEQDHWFLRINPEMKELVGQLDNALCQRWTLKDFARRLKFVLPKVSNPMLLLRVFKHYYFYLSDKTIFFKDPHGFFSTEFIYERYGAKVILLVRHPAGIISSFLRVNWDIHTNFFREYELVESDACRPYVEMLRNKYGKDRLSRSEKIEKLALVWNIFYLQAHLWKKKHPDWILIRHEDFSLDPLRGVEKLFQSLNLDVSSSVKNYILSSTKADNPVEAQNNNIHELNRNSALVAFAWQNQFNSDEMKAIDDITADVRKLYEYGFQTSDQSFLV